MTKPKEVVPFQNCKGSMDKKRAAEAALF